MCIYLGGGGGGGGEKNMGVSVRNDFMCIYVVQ